ncbi:MAG: restriction endonuclease subunit S [Chitinophagales bacterium]
MAARQILQMTPYTKYKPSGIDWIGEIPEHWELLRGDALFDINKEGVETKDLKGKCWMHYSIPAVQEFGTGILEEGDNLDSNKLRIRGGELLISKLNPRKETIVIVKHDEYDKICSGEFVVLIPKKIQLTFAYYLYKSNITKERICSTVQSATKSHQRANPDDIYKIWHYMPPPSEQTAIANYLDEKTAQIDKLISNKQKLIELLKEERTAIINEAVSGKGKNWERKKLKYIVSKVGSGITPSGGASVYLQEGIPLLRSQNIYNDGLQLDDVAYISEEIDNEMSNSRIREGDVLLNITGASIGRCFYVPKKFGRGNVNQHVCILRPIQSKIKTEYLHSFLISGFGQTLIDMCQNGANREGLNFQQIKSFEIPLPEIFEQENILKHIQAETQRIDNTISKIEKEIELMNEYRKALISEVVTGKIKVTA